MNSIIYSIAVPTLNHSSKLEICLNYLAKLNFNPNSYQVLVIDNGSVDNTKEIALHYQNQFMNLRYILCEEPGLMAARHRGLEEAQGEIICYLDDDSLVDSQWLNGIHESFKNPKVVLVGGPCIPRYESEPPYWLQFFWNEGEFGKINGYLSLIDFGENSRIIKPDYVFGCNYNVRKNTLLEAGGTYPDYFPERLRKYQGMGESGISRKINKAGITLYNPAVKIDHIVPSERMTVEYFCWRAYFQGIGNSYMEIRSKNGLEKEAVNFSASFLRKIISKFRIISNYFTNRETDEISMIRREINKSREKGFLFHQKEVEESPVLREWVLRENYLGKNGLTPE
jgi:glycosyltransferase involved in cell wall biosynthesis